jgi:hypothetical protein
MAGPKPPPPLHLHPHLDHLLSAHSASWESPAGSRSPTPARQVASARAKRIQSGVPMYSLRLRQKVAAAGVPLIDEDCNCCDRDCISFSRGVEGLGDIHQDRRRPRSGNMSLSGRYPEHDICENFNAIDVRELQRRTRLRPGLCFAKEWFRNGAPAGEVSIFTQPDAVILVHRSCPPDATESRIVLSDAANVTGVRLITE